jgi:cellulose synthase/poly-beta-1,6-N-acetylglucosamine synthase-like glycosyltransferase
MTFFDVAAGSEPPLIIVFLWLVKLLVVSSFVYKLRLLRWARIAEQRCHQPLIDVGQKSMLSSGRGVHSMVAECDVSLDMDACPRLCVQIPLYNESFHAAGIVQHAAALDWPDERLEIQVLDDSTDDTSSIVRWELDRAQARRALVTFTHIRRGNRQGFKAGALNEGLSRSSADYFAVFDADFRPEPDFLRGCWSHFADDVACVQAPWSFTNADESLLTRVQALMLDTHFRIEHAGRSAAGLVFNFNGTAGIWRGAALRELGGWSDHSITEDLYLSYQAYLSGWRIAFARGLSCPSELPSDLSSFLVQQRRWAKGNGQVLRQLGCALAARRGWGLVKRADVFAHLFGYGLTTLILLVMVLAPWWIPVRASWIGSTSPLQVWPLLDSGIWLMLLASVLMFYTSPEAHHGRGEVSVWERLLRAFVLLFVAPFLSFLLFRSYWEGLLRKPMGSQLVFHRTPKSKTRHVLKSGDHALSAVMVVSVFFLSLLAWHESFFVGSVLFALHAGAGAVVWLRFGSQTVPLTRSIARGQTAA